MVPGKPARIPYNARESCRVVIHQNRLRLEDGLQEVVLEIDVTSATGEARKDASVEERMVLRPGGPARDFWLRGVTSEFDQIRVHVSHVIDQTNYVLSPTAKKSPPSVQWSAVIEGGRARLFVSVTIPGGLSRMNEPSGQFRVNFGVIGRVTWLDRNGKEGLVGLETGLVGVDLIPQRESSVADRPRTLAAVLGVGLRVRIGPGAALGIHLWGAYEFRPGYQYSPDGTNIKDAQTLNEASRWALILGPSISIGNIGTNL
jgi:hypothetical protein